MLFSRFVSLFMLSAAAIVSAHPAAVPASAVAERGTVDIDSVCDTLKSTTDEIILKIDALVAGVIIVTEKKVSPLIAELIAALDSATASLAVLAIEEDTAKKEEIAAILAEIIIAISKSLEGVLLKGGLLLPEIWALLAKVDASLDKVLCAAEVILKGVLVLVGGLIGGVVALLEGLVFKLTLGSCGY